MTTNAGFLLDSMFDFAERFNKMCLIDDEIALFSAVVLLSPGVYIYTVFYILTKSNYQLIN